MFIHCSSSCSSASFLENARGPLYDCFIFFPVSYRTPFKLHPPLLQSGKLHSSYSQIARQQHDASGKCIARALTGRLAHATTSGFRRYLSANGWHRLYRKPSLRLCRERESPQYLSVSTPAARSYYSSSSENACIAAAVPRSQCQLVARPKTQTSCLEARTKFRRAAFKSPLELKTEASCLEKLSRMSIDEPSMNG